MKVDQIIKIVANAPEILFNPVVQMDMIIAMIE
jgi:hypothetical protein